MSRYCAVVPVMLVDQLAPPNTTCPWVCTRGATHLTVDTVRAIALTSSSVSEADVPAPPRAPDCWVDPGWTTSMLAPIEAICSDTRALAPRPIATMVMNAPTPMMIPSVVRSARMRWRTKPRKARRKSAKRLNRASCASDWPRRSR